jgi:hypothetical protein
MQSDVSTIHESSQKRLKGTPKTIGSMRSQAATEKHMAKNGMSPSKIVPREGLFTWKPRDRCGPDIAVPPDNSVSDCRILPQLSVVLSAPNGHSRGRKVARTEFKILPAVLGPQIRIYAWCGSIQAAENVNDAGEARVPW